MNVTLNLSNIEVLKQIKEKSDSLQHYVKFNDDDTVYAIIVMITPKIHILTNDYETFGAFYGYQGGGVNDGGFFKLSSKQQKQNVFNYEDLEVIKETDVNIFEALMNQIWNIVDDKNGEGDLSMTDAGKEFIKKNGVINQRIYTNNNFNTFLLRGIEWGLNLQF